MQTYISQSLEHQVAENVLECMMPIQNPLMPGYVLDFLDNLFDNIHEVAIKHSDE